jgi:hypothetical protein
MADFTFDRQVQRYRDSSTGRFLGELTMRSLTKIAIRIAEDDTLQVADLLIDGKITIAEWQRTTAKTLKQMHIQQYLLGRGGEKLMVDADYEVISNKLKQEFRYLDQFGKDIKSGMSVAQFEARLQLYLNNGRSSYQLGKREGHDIAGFGWERRRLAIADHCQPCIGYANLGWQPIKSLPSIGAECDCRANCQCAFEYSREQPEDSMLHYQFGWIGRGLHRVDRHHLIAG